MEVATKTSEPSKDIIARKQTIQTKLQRRADYANNRRRPIWDCSFKVGDFVKTRAGPIRQLRKKLGPYSFLTYDGYSVNTRHLKLINRPTEFIPLLTEQEPLRRYPIRNRKPVDRYQPG